MERVPSGGQPTCGFELRKPSAIASGTYFEAGDVLLSKITPSFENGKQGIAIGLPGAFGYGSTEIIPLQSSAQNATNLYLFYLLLHHEVRAALVAKMEGSTGRKRVPEAAVRELEIPVPPKPEQEKIAAMLWKLQRAIATQDRLIAVSADLKQSAMQHLFTHGLHGEPLKDTEIGPMPESWRLLPLGNVAKLERGRFTHRPRNDPHFYGGSIPFVQTGDVVKSGGHIDRHTQSLNDEGVAISKVFPKDTILITIAANIGFTGILDFDSACPDSLIGITTEAWMDAEFLNYFLQTQQADMDRLAPKGTQKNINIQFLRPWPTKVPNRDEQRAIASALAAIDRKLAHHRAKRAALNDLFQTLLHKLLTAEIRVADLDIDTSEVTEPAREGVPT